MNEKLLKDLFKAQLDVMDALVRILPEGIKQPLQTVGLNIVKAAHTATEEFLKESKTKEERKDGEKENKVKKVDID